MRRTGQAGRVAHVGHLHAARHATHVAHIRLDDVDHFRINHVLPQRQQAVLLAAGHVQRQGFSHFAGLVHFPIQAGLFKVADAVVLQHPAHLNRARWREAAVGVHQQLHLVAQRFAHRGNNCFGAAWPFVFVVAVFRAHAELESIKTIAVAQCQQARRFVLGRDVAAHAGRIGPQRTRLAAQEFTHRLLVQFSLQVPQRRFHAAQGAHDVRAGKLVLAQRNQRAQARHVVGGAAQRPGRDLAVHDLRGDVGVVGRGLAPALVSAVGGHADKSNKRVGKGFDALDFHGVGAGRCRYRWDGGRHWRGGWLTRSVKPTQYSSRNDAYANL